MSSFSGALVQLVITPNILGLTTKTAEYRGQQSLYEQQIPQVLDTLLNHSIIQSTESSNRIEGIIVNSKRFDSIMNNKSKPNNRSEAEIIGYRDVLKIIHERHQYIPIRPNTILQLHRDLMTYVGSGQGGRWKSVDNVIEEILPGGEKRVRFQPTPAWQTAEAIDELCRTFDANRDFGTWPDVLLIGTFILDFLCIHPFPDGNGRMARLLTLLLLYQSGYLVGKYISIEKVVEDTRDQYYETLFKSSEHWHDGKHDLIPWLEYFLSIIVKAYRLFEERVGDLKSNQQKGWKQKRIRAVVQSFVADFSIADVEERCPGISRPMITKILRDMSKDGTVECIEHGRRARWVLKTK